MGRTTSTVLQYKRVRILTRSFERPAWARPRSRLGHDAPGLAATEYALVLPTFLFMVMGILAISLLLTQRIWVAGAAPNDARANAGVGEGGQLGALGSGTTLRVVEAPGCERAHYGRVTATYSVTLPFIDGWSIPLRGGSVQRDWQFHPGPPDDGCQ